MDDYANYTRPSAHSYPLIIRQLQHTTLSFGKIEKKALRQSYGAGDQLA